MVTRPEMTLKGNASRVNVKWRFSIRGIAVCPVFPASPVRVAASSVDEPPSADLLGFKIFHIEGSLSLFLYYSKCYMQGKPKRIGRPRLPKNEAKGKIVPVRFEPDDLKLVTDAARAGDQVLSEWIRQTLRATAEVQMYNGTLHEAIRIVLLNRESHTGTTRDISDEIGRRGLYARKDGEAARAQQINARVRQYPELFEFVEPGIVRLASTSLGRSGKN